MYILSRLLVVAVASLALVACASTGGGVSSVQTVDSSTLPPAASPASATSQSAPPVAAVVGLPPNPGAASTYRIGPHDLLAIQVFQVEELSSEERVGEDGTVVMSLIGAVQVGGLTPKEAESRIAAALGQSYLQNPQVNIFVKEYASQNVTVTGAVKKPGVFPLQGRMTLLQGIAMAEGVNTVANDNEVVIFRSDPTGATRAYVVDLEKVEKGTLADPVLIADDRVIVPESGTQVFVQNLTGALRGLVSLNPLLY
jgi:polysaccharide export outer membrane protein